jgi:secretion/DNA translocation related TadE-like protein
VSASSRFESDRKSRRDIADGGYATVWVVAAIAIVVVVAAVATGYGAAVVERHRASAAADATALEVALSSIAGRTAACRAGAVVAERNGATLRRCDVQDAIAAVVVEIRLRGVLSMFGSAEGRARAGPASETVRP